MASAPYIYNDSSPEISGPGRWILTDTPESTEYRRRITNYGTSTILVKEHTGFIYPVKTSNTFDTDDSGFIVVTEQFDLAMDALSTIKAAINQRRGKDHSGFLVTLQEIIETQNYCREGNTQRFKVEVETKIDHSLLMQEGSIYHLNSNLLFSSKSIHEIPEHPQSTGAKERIYREYIETHYDDKCAVLKLELVDNSGMFDSDVWLAAKPELYYRLRPIKDPARQDGLHVWTKNSSTPAEYFVEDIDNPKDFAFRGMRIYTTYEAVKAIDDSNTLTQKQLDVRVTEISNRQKEREMENKLVAEEQRALTMRYQREVETLKTENMRLDHELSKEQKRIDLETSKVTHQHKQEESSLKRDITIVSLVIGGLALVKKLFF